MAEKVIPDLASLQRAFNEARKEYDEAASEARISSHRESSAREKLNNAMKALDAAMQTIRDANAEWNTSWSKCK